MELTQDEVIHILNLINEAPIGRFRLQVGDLNMEVAKGAAAASETTLRAGNVVDADAGPVKPEPVTVERRNDIAAVTSTEIVETNLAAINAPILGIFYRQADPGSPPYVEVGSIVTADTTVALMEIMKLFNPVKAGMRGRIRKICVDNGQLVEFGQPLFLVQPE
jgi:acetyl-CoA carboxylase biotin carboxyl carrier protein